MRISRSKPPFSAYNLKVRKLNKRLRDQLGRSFRLQSRENFSAIEVLTPQQETSILEMEYTLTSGNTRLSNAATVVQCFVLWNRYSSRKMITANHILGLCSTSWKRKKRYYDKICCGILSLRFFLKVARGFFLYSSCKARQKGIDRDLESFTFVANLGVFQYWLYSVLPLQFAERSVHSSKIGVWYTYIRGEIISH